MSSHVQDEEVGLEINDALSLLQDESAPIMLTTSQNISLKILRESVTRLAGIQDGGGAYLNPYASLFSHLDYASTADFLANQRRDWLLQLASSFSVT